MHSCFPFVNRFVLMTLPYFFLSLQSPDGYTVVSTAADETLRFWKIFGAPDTSKNDNNNDADTSKNDNTKDAKVDFSNFHTHIR